MLRGQRLTPGEIRLLEPGTAIDVIWSGGNGPHRYYVVIDCWGNRCASNVYEDRLVDDGAIYTVNDVRLPV